MGIAPAQETTGVITGTVTDPTGSVIPAAMVSLTNQGTEVVIETETGGDGVYMVRDLPPGRHTVRFEAPGFQDAGSAGRHLADGQDVARERDLEVGDVTETVVVTEAAQLIDTASTMVAQNITSKSLICAQRALVYRLGRVVAFGKHGQLEGGFQINGASGARTITISTAFPRTASSTAALARLRSSTICKKFR
ncbi:MAG: carboxypeptidase-like regulatory domain-containing protein [Bryobacterales bacterium]